MFGVLFETSLCAGSILDEFSWRRPAGPTCARNSFTVKPLECAQLEWHLHARAASRTFEVVLFDFGGTRLVPKRAFCVGASFFFCESDRGLFVGRVSKQQMTLTLKVLSSVGPSIRPGPESRSLHSASSAVRGSHHRVADASGVRNFVSWWCASFLRTVPAGASATAPATLAASLFHR